MTLKNTLQNYFNSGSPDKRMKRRIGGIFVAVVAVALVVSLIVLLVAGIASAIKNKKNNGEDGPVSVSIETVSGSIDEINANLNDNTTLLDDYNIPTATDELESLGIDNRTRIEISEGVSIYVYGCNDSTRMLRKEAFDAFEALAVALYNATDKCLFVRAYGDGDIYADGLTIKLTDVTGTFGSDDYGGCDNASIFEDGSYSWLYNNAANYGFVRVNNVEGQENIFRYVGLAHAKALGKTATEDTIASYIAEIKNTTAEAPRVVTGIKNHVEGNTKSYDAYIYFVPNGETYNLPNADKYTFTADNVGDGYIITCYSK